MLPRLFSVHAAIKWVEHADLSARALLICSARWSFVLSPSSARITRETNSSRSRLSRRRSSRASKTTTRLPPTRHSMCVRGVTRDLLLLSKTTRARSSACALMHSSWRKYALHTAEVFSPLLNVNSGQRSDRARLSYISPKSIHHYHQRPLTSFISDCILFVAGRSLSRIPVRR